MKTKRPQSHLSHWFNGSNTNSKDQIRGVTTNSHHHCGRNAAQMGTVIRFILGPNLPHDSPVNGKWPHRSCDLTSVKPLHKSNWFIMTMANWEDQRRSCSSYMLGILCPQYYGIAIWSRCFIETSWILWASIITHRLSMSHEFGFIIHCIGLTTPPSPPYEG